MPARPPPSIDMLQSVSRPSIDNCRMPLPAYSRTWPVPPAVPILAMMARITSLPVMPKPKAPSMSMRMVLGFFCHSDCVAMTCVTSDEPMPKARQPSAPCVDVWLSPQTSVMPGKVKPCSGPTTCTMPLRRSPMSNTVTPCAAPLMAKPVTMRWLSGFFTSSLLRVSVGM